jgi:CRP-like cAMP-binding protein
LDDARRLLGNCSLFRGLAPRELEALIAYVIVCNYDAGATIFLMGSAGDSLMTVLSGSVGISVSAADGREIRLATFGEGEFFGEIALFDGKRRSATAIAITACRLAVLQRRDLLAFLNRHPAIWLKIVEALCSRLRSTDQQIAEVALLPLPVRLAKVLVRIATHRPREPARGSPWQVSVSQGELGKIVGASRESVNRCFRDWQRGGVVTVKEGVITILDRSGLEQLAEIE